MTDWQKNPITTQFVSPQPNTIKLEESHESH